MIRGETGRDKVLFSFQRGRTANGRTAIAGSPALPAPGRQISGYLPASGSLENQTDSDTFPSRTSSYLPHIFRTSRSVLVHPPLSGGVLLRQWHVDIMNKYYRRERGL